MARKTTFFLEKLEGCWIEKAEVSIVGQSPDSKPYVNIEVANMSGKRILLGIQDKDLERFAVNILKALGSKKLSLSTRYNSNDFFRKPKKT